MNIYEKYDLGYNKESNNIMKINKEYDIVYDKKYDEVALYRNKKECFWYISKGKYIIHHIDERDLKELENIKDNIIIKYITELDKRNKKNKLKENDLEETYDNLKYIIENNKE